MIAQSVVIGTLTRRYTEVQLISFSILVATLSYSSKKRWNSSRRYVGMTFASHLYTFLIVLVPFVLSTSMTNTCTTSIITKMIKREDVGMTLGVSDSLDSLGRVIAPTIGSMKCDVKIKKQQLIIQSFLLSQSDALAQQKGLNDQLLCVKVS